MKTPIAYLFGTTRPVRKGEEVTDFRGDKATFLYVSRPPSPGKSAKIVVEHPNGATGEYYERVFGLEVR